MLLRQATSEPSTEVPASETPTRHDLTADQINRLFDVVIHRRNFPKDTYFRERAIFIWVLGESEETEKCVEAFLRDVRTCPVEVVRFCQEELLPKRAPRP